MSKLPELIVSRIFHSPVIRRSWQQGTVLKVVLLASLLFFRGMALATPSGPCGLSLQVMVSEQDNFHAVPGMVVWISGKEPVATDENGQAAFFGLCRGLHVLTTSHMGYDPVTMQVSMEASKPTTRLHFRQWPHPVGSLCSWGQRPYSGNRFGGARQLYRNHPRVLF